MENKYGQAGLQPGATFIAPAVTTPTIHEIATQAMNGLLSCDDCSLTTKELARQSYRIAVEMEKYRLIFEEERNKERAKNA